MTKFKFECGSEDRWSDYFGPFDYVQLTGSELSVGPDGEVVAVLHDGWWVVCEHTAQLPQELHGSRWSDVIIFGSSE